MPNLTNPAAAQNRGLTLLGLLGSFWTSMYNDNGTVAEYARARNQAELQAFCDLMELVACASRFDIPIYHRSNWSVITLRKSQKIADLLTYGEGVVFGNNPGSSGVIYQYGVTMNKLHSYAYPANMADVSVIVNRISEPSITLTKYVDFTINPANGTIGFRQDPFDNVLNISYPIYDSSGNQIDSEMQLWLFMADYDWGLLYEQFGYAFNTFMESSENYKTLINLLWDSLVQGSTYQHLETMLALLTNTPLIIESTETVEAISTETDRTLVLTDKHVYEVSPTATVLVTVGQMVKAGDRLVDAFTLYRPYRDTLPSATIPSLALGKGILIGPFQEDLVFYNRGVPLHVSTDPAGRTRVEWELGGRADDVTLFWDTVHTNGTAVGAISLAQLLDSRYPPAQTPDPTGVNLPTTINPLDFLAKNVLRNNAAIVVFKVDSYGPEAMLLSSIGPLRQIVPAHSTVFILVLVSVEDTIAMTGSGDSLVAGYMETVTGGSFYAPDPIVESSPESFIDADNFTFSQIPD